MRALAKNGIVLQTALSTSIQMGNRYRRGYDDLTRLLEPDGRVYTLVANTRMFWCGGKMFTPDATNPNLYIGGRIKALEELGDLFGTEGASIGVPNTMPFYFEAMGTKITFEFQRDRDYKGVRVWDRYNEMWRRFEILLDSQGLEIKTDKEITVWVRDADTDIRINLDILDKTVVNAWVEKEGNLGIVDAFTIHSVHPFFTHMRLIPLATDHPGFEVEEYPGGQISDVTNNYMNLMQHQHQNNMSGGNVLLNDGGNNRNNGNFEPSGGFRPGFMY